MEEWLAVCQTTSELKQITKDFNVKMDFVMDNFERKMDKISTTDELKLTTLKTFINDVNNQSNSINIHQQQLQQHHRPQFQLAGQMLENPVDGCCEIKHIVDSDKCLCYIVDTNW